HALAETWILASMAWYSPGMYGPVRSRIWSRPWSTKSPGCWGSPVSPPICTRWRRRGFWRRWRGIRPACTGQFVRGSGVGRG
ncbi:hypothetical protein CQA18_27590, partial [Enterobacter hormaechei]